MTFWHQLIPWLHDLGSCLQGSVKLDFCAKFCVRKTSQKWALKFTTFLSLERLWCRDAKEADGGTSFEHAKNKNCFRNLLFVWWFWSWRNREQISSFWEYLVSNSFPVLYGQTILLSVSSDDFWWIYWSCCMNTRHRQGCVHFWFMIALRACSSVFSCSSWSQESGPALWLFIWLRVSCRIFRSVKCPQWLLSLNWHFSAEVEALENSYAHYNNSGKHGSFLDIHAPSVHFKTLLE